MVVILFSSNPLKTYYHVDDIFVDNVLNIISNVPVPSELLALNLLV